MERHGTPCVADMCIRINVPPQTTNTHLTNRILCARCVLFHDVLGAWNGIAYIGYGVCVNNAHAYQQSIRSVFHNCFVYYRIFLVLSPAFISNTHSLQTCSKITSVEFAISRAIQFWFTLFNQRDSLTQSVSRQKKFIFSSYQSAAAWWCRN